ncbi:45805_t:CDS:2 [Gigaspora margarita]|uniref:45805_t:CDS:1 n=1 Tax=Gigaspora margarita TaxID=4874 RepID=A0ABN7UR21_GIGMA|nr:45805_t:CDS:2 [Gigaspora margarita]
MSNDIKETVNVPLVYLLQLQHLAIQSIEKKHHDFLVKNNEQKKTIHENHLFSEQVPSQHGEINSKNNNELVNQNMNEYNFQLISNNLNLSNEISENSQEITRDLNIFNSEYLNYNPYNPYLSPFTYLLPYPYNYFI